MSADRQRTTMKMDRKSLDRLKALMPYESMSYEEFVMKMADDYEDKHGRARHISGQVQR